MRHFKLVNSSGKELDITTKSVLFHGISGLGFEEQNDFRQIGDFWMLNRTGRNQATVSGNVIFTDAEDTSPYAKYRDFVEFISKTPLTLFYNPYGPIDLIEDAEDIYRRTARVSKLEKSEITQQGILDCAITFACYTPWYQIIKRDYNYVTPEEENPQAWVWGNTSASFGDLTPPLIFEPQEGGTYCRAQFRFEVPKSFDMDLTVLDDCPAKVTIFGPLLNPSWTHRVITKDANDNDISTVVSTGGFSTPVNSPVEIGDGEQLVIDGTDGNYSIYRINVNGTITDLYSKRNFGLPCFINLKEGSNQISVVSSSGDRANHIIVEGHVYHATV